MRPFTLIRRSVRALTNISPLVNSVADYLTSRGWIDVMYHKGTLNEDQINGKINWLVIMHILDALCWDIFWIPSRFTARINNLKGIIPKISFFLWKICSKPLLLSKLKTSTCCFFPRVHSLSQTQQQHAPFNSPDERIDKRAVPRRQSKAEKAEE